MATSTLGAQMHPEIDRLKREFGWTPDSVATWDDASSTWRAKGETRHDSTFTDHVSELVGELSMNSWWYSTRNHIILRTLRDSKLSQTLCDVGGGTGAVSQFLGVAGQAVIGVEPSERGAAFAARREVLSFQSSLEDLRLPPNSLHALSLFDVLEHLDDRAALLRELSRVLIPSGVLVITVPAFTALWSQADIDAGHFLRYNKRTLRKELELHGFEVVRSGYFFALTVIPLLLLRALPYRLGIRKAVATEATLGASGGFVGKLAAIVERAIAMKTPIGSSLLVIAKKR
jgi:SAM-dependent methyltransferase